MADRRGGIAIATSGPRGPVGLGGVARRVGGEAALVEAPLQGAGRLRVEAEAEVVAGLAEAAVVDEHADAGALIGPVEDAADEGARQLVVLRDQPLLAIDQDVNVLFHTDDGTAKAGQAIVALGYLYARELGSFYTVAALFGFTPIVFGILGLVGQRGPSWLAYLALGAMADPTGGPDTVHWCRPFDAARKGMSLREAERWLAPNLGYEPED